MPERRDPLEGIGRLVVDGTNLLYALRRPSAPLAPAGVIGRLRGIVPQPISIVVVLDGSPEHGLAARRVASGVQVHYAGRESADAVIARLVAEPGPDSASRMLVVTDDAELTFAARRAGARTARNRWLIARLTDHRLTSPSPGASRTAPVPEPASDEEDVQWRWSPGRGATRKRGNPRRSPKR